MQTWIRPFAHRAALVVAAVAASACASPTAAPPAPPAPVVEAAPAPKLLETGLQAAVGQQKALLAAAVGLQVNSALPPAPAHSAGAEAVVAEAAVAAPPTAEQDAAKIAIFFAGGEIGETDPCG